MPDVDVLTQVVDDAEFPRNPTAGIWYLYPCAYRLFDVDDLLANTTGAVLALALRLMGERASDRPADAPREVTTWRRLLGMVGDFTAI